jgi:predicted nucleic acid-binding protein
MILLDTNILLRSKQFDSPFYQGVNQKILDFLAQGEVLAVAPQTIYEFYTVASRPISVNGLNLALEDIQKEIDDILFAYELLVETETVFNHWRNLTKNYEIKGKTTHDARLVAIMLTHHIEKLYTLNIDDFKRFGNIIQLV